MRFEFRCLAVISKHQRVGDHRILIFCFIDDELLTVMFCSSFEQRDEQKDSSSLVTTTTVTVLVLLLRCKEREDQG